MKTLRFIVPAVLYLLIWTNSAYSLKEDTHEVIDKNIAGREIAGFSFNNYLKSVLGFSDGSNVILFGYSGRYQGYRRQAISEWLSEGGFMEDAPANLWNFLPIVSDTRGKRHFHNPLEPNWSIAGLNDIYTGMPSIVVWAQTDNQDPKANIWGHFFNLDI